MVLPENPCGALPQRALRCVWEVEGIAFGMVLVVVALLRVCCVTTWLRHCLCVATVIIAAFSCGADCSGCCVVLISFVNLFCTAFRSRSAALMWVVGAGKSKRTRETGCC
ncbi:hypothetical protein TcCL_ESM00849 [Trypanosoma cruzi]|nr:hypothetical protein TcCL_ESM00849 [Trypanosoma cruzi]